MEGPTRNDQILKVDPNRVAFDSTFHYLPPLSLSTVSVYEERDFVYEEKVSTGTKFRRNMNEGRNLTCVPRKAEAKQNRTRN